MTNLKQKSVIEKVKAIQCVFDWNLWPRQSIGVLDSTNLAQMRECLRNGFPLPPIVINQKDFRIIDGFHRVRATLDVNGDEAEIEAIVKDYENDSDMLLESGRLNAFQGLKLSPKDRAYFIVKCRHLKIPMAVIAQTLNMSSDTIKLFISKRTAKSKTGKTIILSHGAVNLAGKTLTDEQEHYAETCTGSVPEMYISMLINALKAEAMQLTEKTLKRLKELKDIIDTIIDEGSYE